MVMIKGNANSEAGVHPSEELAEQMGAYNEELVAAGVRLAAEGLEPKLEGRPCHFQRRPGDRCRWSLH